MGAPMTLGGVRIVTDPRIPPRLFVLVYARGRVFKTAGGWHMEVIAAGRVVHADNTGGGRAGWAAMLDECRRSTHAFHEVLSTGHRLKDKTWARVVDRAMGEP